MIEVFFPLQKKVILSKRFAKRNVYIRLIFFYYSKIALEINDESVQWAVAGDNVSISISGIDILQFR